MTKGRAVPIPPLSLDSSYTEIQELSSDSEDELISPVELDLGCAFRHSDPKAGGHIILVLNLGLSNEGGKRGDQSQ